MRVPLIFLAALAASPAGAATFKSEAHGHTVAVFSSSKTLEHCRSEEHTSELQSH